MENKILILYYSRTGAVKSMAQKVAQGVESVKDCEAVLRTVPFSEADQIHHATKHEALDPFVTLDDLKNCDGLVMGSPTRFGNMAAGLKNFWDTTASIWFSGALINKPAGLFTSTSTMHSGQESTLLTMMIPLLHHGMIIVGVPASEPDTLSTRTGGSFYGATHFAGGQDNLPLSEEEIRICIALGKRVANISKKMK